MSSSEPRQTLAIPAAILAGSIIIGAGLFFGLQSRAPQPPGMERERRPARGGGADAPAVTDELKSTVAKQAAKALEAEREELVKACWEPAVKASPEPPKAKYIYNVSFDADGKEIARGVSETREMSRSDVAQCLRDRPLSLRIPPPGVNVGVDVTFILP